MLRSSVIVCTASDGRFGLLVQCVDAILGGSRRPDELFVIVDHNDALTERLRAQLPSSVAVLPNTGAPGLSEGRNTGIAAATGDVVAFTDDDAIPENDWLEELIRPLEDDGALLGVGGRVEPKWEVVYRWLPGELHWIWGGTYKGHTSVPGPIRNPYGGNMAFRRDAVVEAGGFSAEFGKSGTALATADETAFSLQLADTHGAGRIWYAPTALVHHVVPKSRLSLKFFVRRCLSEGQSKAQLETIFGGPSLGTERRFALKLVTRSLPGYFGQTLRHRNLDGIRSAVTLVAGLSLTGFAFLYKSMVLRLAR